MTATTFVPVKCLIVDDLEGVRSIAITTGDGTVQVLKLKDPLRLPQATQG